jgi:hypothetical protein
MYKHYLAFLTSLLCLLFFDLQANPSEKYKPENPLKNSIESETESIIISFNQKFNFPLSENTSWSIINQKDNKIIGNGVGYIAGFNFVEPGKYVLNIIDNTVHNPAECNHSHVPSNILIEVSDMEMIFDFNTIQFSQEIIGGQELQNVVLSIEVDFKHYNNQPTEFSNSVRSAGVDANITGSISAKQILTPGKNKLVYQLSGSAAKNTYIMFDFIDVNGQIQTYYHTTKLN